MKILVVEDQDSIRRMIEALVTGRGHEVTGVSNGAQALEACMHKPPDIVLLDLNLPGLYDGFEVCKRLRLDPSTQRTPVVIISAMDDEQSRQKASESGATAYYTKPFSPIALLKEIEKYKARRSVKPPSP